MSITCAQYAAMLAEAQTALQKLMTGGAVESLRAGEKQLTYSRAGVDDLQRYIAFLQGKVDACNGATTNRRRVIGVIPCG